MINSVIVIGAVLAVGFAKSKIGGFNLRGNYNNVPRGRYFNVVEIAKYAGVSEFEATKALRKFLKQGKVWNNAGLYMFH